MAWEDGFRIGPHEVLPRQGRIRDGAASVHIEPKAMEVLLDLARHAGEVRSRAQIEAAVWPHRIVGEDVLTRCIGQLRRALGDDARAPGLIETIPKRGYRLRQAIQASAVAEPAQMVESLLVLPLRRLTAATDAYLADSLTELLILRLCSLQGVRILSRTTAMQFQGSSASLAEIAARSGAQWLVEGAVMQSGARVQVVAQLIDARVDAHVWAGDTTRELQDIMTALNDIAEQVARAIRVRLTGRASPARGAAVLGAPAMRDYLRARQLLSRRAPAALREAAASFQAVVTAAPGFAPAWASMAECEMLLVHYGAAAAAEVLPDCQAHIERALELDAELGMALSVRGALRFFFALDFDGAERDLLRALELMPSYPLAMVQLANLAAVRHQPQEASAWIAQALLLDPLDVGVHMNHGDHLILQRRWADAARALRRALELAPGHGPSLARLAWALALDGRAGAARELLAAVARTGGRDAPWLEYAALVEGAAGDAAAARLHHDALVQLARTQPVPAWSLARAAAAAGLRARALDALAAAARAKSSSLPFLRVTPAFASLHGEPEFEALAERLPAAVAR